MISNSVVDKAFFKSITYNLAHVPDIEDYYYKLIEFLQSSQTDHPDIKDAVLHRSFIEENYDFAPRPQPEPLAAFDDANTPEEIIKAIDKLIDRDLPDDQVIPVINYCAPDFKWHPKQLLDYYYLRKKVREEQDFKMEIELELNKTLSLQQCDIELTDFLPNHLAAALTLYCQILPSQTQHRSNGSAHRHFGLSHRWHKTFRRP